MQKRYYVYKLIDPRNNQPFYIGKGEGLRAKSHIYEAHKPRNEWYNENKNQTILDIENEGKSVIIKKVKENLLEQEAYDLEISLIKKYGKTINGSGILTNISDGGLGGNPEGLNVWCFSMEGDFIAEYKSIPEAEIASGVHRNTIHNNLYGNTTTAGNYRWCYKNGKLLEIKSNNKPIIQCDLDGNEIKEYPSVIEAHKKTGIRKNGISEAASILTGSRRSTAGGFRWKYKGQELKSISKKSKRISLPRILECIKDGKVIKTFPSLKDASEKTGARINCICDCISGNIQSAGGFNWNWKYL